MFDSLNCYLCNIYTGVIKNSIHLKSTYTETPIFKILDQILYQDDEDGKLEENDNILCQDCFLLVEKYDYLQFQKEEIQKNLLEKLSKGRLRRIEQVYIKTEEDSQHFDQENLQNLRLKCVKCRKSFNNVDEMMEHTHELQPSNDNLQDLNLLPKSKASKFRRKVQSSQEASYSLEAFQDAFFSEKEKRNCALKSAKFENQIPKENQDKNQSNSEISYNFKKFIENQGISYNLQKFHKAFGYTENGKPMNNSSQRLIMKTRNIATSKKNIKIKPKLSEDFISSLSNSGVSYNLQTFQKAFGFDANDMTHDSVDESEYETIFQIENHGQGCCPHCNISFNSKISYINHLKTHRPTNKQTYCFECKKQFKSFDGYQIHIASSHDKIEGPLNCPQCQKVYPDKQALRCHLYIHQDHSEFLCVVCGSVFKNRKNFKMHMMTHNDEKNFACTYTGCSKKFQTKTKLRIHELVHTQVKNFECPFCVGKKFAQKWGMDLHVRKHHKNQPRPDQTCNICGMTLQSKAKLKRHLEKYHNIT